MEEAVVVRPCLRARGVVRRRRRLLHRWVRRQGPLLLPLALVWVSRGVESLAVVVRRSRKLAVRTCL